MIGENNYFPKNFDDVLATIVYERLDIISKKYFNNFRFYNFSYFTIDNFYYIDDGSYYSRDGKISFIVSSVDEEFIRFFISRLIVEGLIYEDNYLKVVDVSLIDDTSHIKRDLVVVPSYIDKGLEFDSVIIYNDKDNMFTKEDKYLYYVACTRAQHNLVIYK